MKKGMISLEDWKKELIGNGSKELKEKYKADQPINEFISVILKYRKENNLTQRQLANELGITLRMVKNIEQFDCDRISFKLVGEILGKLDKMVTISDNTDELTK